MSEKKVKNLKIKYIDITDFKNIDSINTDFADWNVIGGYNANGKSSLVEAILTAIQGQKFYGNWAVTPASLVKSWEDRAVISLIIGWDETEILIQREFRTGNTKNPAGKTELSASINGEKIDQRSLDSLLTSLTIDPLKLWNLSISEQIKEIKNTIGLDTTEIDKKIKDQETYTSESRAYKKTCDTLYEAIVSSGIPKRVEKNSVSSLIEERDIVESKERKLQEYRNQEIEIARIEEMLEKAKTKLEQIKQEWSELHKICKERNLWTIEEINQKIQNIEEENKQEEKYNRYIEAKKKRDEAEEEFEKDEKILAELRSERTKIIASSNIPEYMEISGELWILVDWIEYKLLNTARKIEVAIDLVLISGSPLRMIRIEQGGELDVKTLEKVKEKILQNNFQIFIERPIIDKFDSIIISDWEIVEDKETFIANQ